jgi:hypothetical protein
MPNIVKFSDLLGYKFYLALDLFLKLRDKTKIERSCGTNLTKKWLQNQVERLRSNAESDSYLSRFGSPYVNLIPEIEEVYNLKIKIWLKSSRTYTLAWETEKNTPNKSDCLNLFSEKFDKFFNKDLTEVSLILDPEKLGKKVVVETNNKLTSCEMNIFQALVRELHPQLSGNSFDEKVKIFQIQWGSDEVCLHEIKNFYKVFQIGIQIWRTGTRNNKILTSKIFDTYWKRRLILSVKQLNLAKPITLKTKFRHIEDIDKLNHYSCTNKYCFFGSNDLQKFRAHENYCRTEPLVTYKQQSKSKTIETIPEELYQEGFLPSADFFNFFFIAYDIECLMARPDEDANKSILSIHKLVSIAFKARSFNQHNKI